MGLELVLFKFDEQKRNCYKRILDYFPLQNGSMIKGGSNGKIFITLFIFLSVFIIIQNKESYGSGSDDYCHVNSKDLTYYGYFTSAECKKAGGILGKMWNSNRPPRYKCLMQSEEMIVYYGRSWSYERARNSCSKVQGEFRLE